ncbi:hypothetical protein FPV67DRAFT_1399969, partial [Lyophyllum atratum]
LTAGADTLDKYYNKTADSDAHILAMLLHPGKKMSHFKKYWSKDLQVDVHNLVESV